MEGLTIAILMIMLVLGVLFSWRTRQGSAALESVAGDFPLTPERAAQIAVEAGLTSRERTQGRSVPVMRTADGLRLEIASKEGVMAFEFHEHAGTACSRVEGHAEEIAVIRFPELGGLGTSPTSARDLKMGMPRNPAKLLRRRERVFWALTAAARGDERRPAGARDRETCRPWRERPRGGRALKDEGARSGIGAGVDEVGRR